MKAYAGVFAVAVLGGIASMLVDLYLRFSQSWRRVRRGQPVSCVPVLATRQNSPAPVVSAHGWKHALPREDELERHWRESW